MLKTRLDNLTSVGRGLMDASSTIRASDIEHKLSKLSDTWQRLDDKAVNRQVTPDLDVTDDIS